MAVGCSRESRWHLSASQLAVALRSQGRSRYESHDTSLDMVFGVLSSHRYSTFQKGLTGCYCPSRAVH